MQPGQALGGIKELRELGVFEGKQFILIYLSLSFLHYEGFIYRMLYIIYVHNVQFFLDFAFLEDKAWNVCLAWKGHWEGLREKSDVPVSETWTPLSICSWTPHWQDVSMKTLHWSKAIPILSSSTDKIFTQGGGRESVEFTSAGMYTHMRTHTHGHNIHTVTQWPMSQAWKNTHMQIHACNNVPTSITPAHLCILYI